MNTALEHSPGSAAIGEGVAACRVLTRRQELRRTVDLSGGALSKVDIAAALGIAVVGSLPNTEFEERAGEMVKRIFGDAFPTDGGVPSLSYVLKLLSGASTSPATITSLMTSGTGDVFGGESISLFARPLLERALAAPLDLGPLATLASTLDIDDVVGVGLTATLIGHYTKKMAKISENTVRLHDFSALTYSVKSFTSTAFGNPDPIAAALACYHLYRSIRCSGLQTQSLLELAELAAQESGEAIAQWDAVAARSGALDTVTAAVATPHRPGRVRSPF